jgi:hypothetical protein
MDLEDLPFKVVRTNSHTEILAGPPIADRPRRIRKLPQSRANSRNNSKAVLQGRS